MLNQNMWFYCFLGVFGGFTLLIPLLGSLFPQFTDIIVLSGLLLHGSICLLCITKGKLIIKPYKYRIPIRVLSLFLVIEIIFTIYILFVLVNWDVVLT